MDYCKISRNECIATGELFATLMHYLAEITPEHLSSEGTSLLEWASRIGKYVSTHEHWGILARDEGTPVGFILFAVNRRGIPFIRKRYLVIDDLFVSNSHRNRGIAKELLGIARQAAINYGCSCIELDVLSTNVPAQEFYQHNGFKPMQMHMCMTLTDK